MIQFNFDKSSFLNQLGNIYNWFKKKPAVLTILLSIILILGIALYITKVNSIATRGHQVKDLEGILFEMKQQEYAYMVESAELRSMQRIEKGIAALNLQKEGDKEYIETSSLNIFAKK